MNIAKKITSLLLAALLSVASWGMQEGKQPNLRLAHKVESQEEKGAE